MAKVLQEEKGEGGVKIRKKWRGEKGVEVCEKLIGEEWGRKRRVVFLFHY